MGHKLPNPELSAGFARELSRRRLLAGMGLAAAGLRFAPHSAFAVQTATPSADQPEVDRLLALSQSLCGGGTFDPGQGATLLTLMTSDPSLARGLDELYAAPATPVPAATPIGTPSGESAQATPVASTRSPDAQAAAQAILLFWYAGVFKDQPIQDRSSVYTNLVAWQAMYTPSWTTCKLFGGWADAPTLTPQQPENA